jgi:integrase/recombinase XerD
MKHRRGLTSLVRSAYRLPRCGRKLELVAAFAGWMTDQGYVPSTRQGYDRTIRKLCTFLGRKTFEAVSPFDIAAFMADASAPFSDSYAVNLMCALRCFFDFLCLGGVVDSVAPRLLHFRSPVKKLPRILTKSQVLSLLRKTKHPRDKAIMELMYATGCRARELIKIRVQDVDFHTKQIRVCGKRKERIVYFGRPAKKALVRYLAGRKSGFLFEDIFTRQTGFVSHWGSHWYGNWTEHRGNELGVRRHVHLGKWSPLRRDAHQLATREFIKRLQTIELGRLRHGLTYESILLIVRSAGERLGIRRLTTRTLRHSFACHLIDGGADLLTVQRLLGHSHVTSTEIYARISNARVAKNYLRCHPTAS